MKKIISFTAILACLTFFVNAQTTMEDYRYVTTGFKNDMWKGLGIRPGYALEKVGSKVEIIMGRDSKGAQLFALIINGVTKAHMVSVWDSESNRAIYCIPTNDSNSEIKAAAENDISKADKDTKYLIQKLRAIY